MASRSNRRKEFSENYNLKTRQVGGTSVDDVSEGWWSEEEELESTWDILLRMGCCRCLEIKKLEKNWVIEVTWCDAMERDILDTLWHNFETHEKFRLFIIGTIHNCNKLSTPLCVLIELSLLRFIWWYSSMTFV